MDDSNSNLLHYGFTSLDDEIAKDQMDAEHVFRNDSTNLDNSTSGADAVLQNVNPSTILDMTSQQDILSQDSQSCDTQQTDIQTVVDALKVKSRINYTARSRKRKITRNMKDENAPKLPQTGYVMYMTERRDSIKALYPNISFPELTKRIAAEWSNMDSATKKRYLDTAEENKAKYLEELSAYQQTEAFKTFQKRKQQETDTCKPMPQQIVANPPKEQQAKLPGFDVPIFTEDFLEHNKAREKELRELRKLNTQYEEQNAILGKHVDQLKAVLTSLEEEATIQRNNNLALVQHLESLRDTLVSNFTSIPLPDTNEVPTVGTVDNYMAKLHQLILDTPQEHEELIVAVREVVNKLNLEAYVT